MKRSEKQLYLVSTDNIIEATKTTLRYLANKNFISKAESFDALLNASNNNLGNNYFYSYSIEDLENYVNLVNKSIVDGTKSTLLETAFCSVLYSDQQGGHGNSQHQHFIHRLGQLFPGLINKILIYLIKENFVSTAEVLDKTINSEKANPSIKISILHLLIDKKFFTVKFINKAIIQNDNAISNIIDYCYVVGNQDFIIHALAAQKRQYSIEINPFIELNFSELLYLAVPEKNNKLKYLAKPLINIFVKTLKMGTLSSIESLFNGIETLIIDSFAKSEGFLAKFAIHALKQGNKTLLKYIVKKHSFPLEQFVDQLNLDGHNSPFCDDLKNLNKVLKSTKKITELINKFCDYYDVTHKKLLFSIIKSESLINEDKVLYCNNLISLINLTTEFFSQVVRQDDYSLLRFFLEQENYRTSLLEIVFFEGSDYIQQLCVKNYPTKINETLLNMITSDHRCSDFIYFSRINKMVSRCFKEFDPNEALIHSMARTRFGFQEKLVLQYGANPNKILGLLKNNQLQQNEKLLKPCCSSIIKCINNNPCAKKQAVDMLLDLISYKDSRDLANVHPDETTNGGSLVSCLGEVDDIVLNN